MYNYFRYNTKLRFCLISKIKGMSEGIKHTKSLLQNLEKDCLFNAFNTSNIALSIDVRHHLLAYAFMRGVPYAKLESKCTYKPNPNKIISIILYHVGYNEGGVAERVSQWLK